MRQCAASHVSLSPGVTVLWAYLRASKALSMVKFVISTGMMSGAGSLKAVPISALVGMSLGFFPFPFVFTFLYYILTRMDDSEINLDSSVFWPISIIGQGCGWRC